MRLTKNGRLIDISLSISPLRDTSGQIVGASKIARDISEQKRLQQALQESELHFRHHSAQQVMGLTKLNELSSNLAQIRDPQAMLEVIVSTIVSLHQAGRGLLSLYNPETGDLHVNVYFGFDEKFKASLSTIPPGVGSCGVAFNEKRRIIVEDTETDPLFDSLRALMRAYQIKAIHSTPIVSRSGQCIGSLSVCFNQSRRPTELEIQFADICAKLAADFLERSNSEELLRENEVQLGQELEAMRNLYHHSLKLTSADSLQSALNEVLEAGIRITEADFGNVRILNSDRSGLEIVAHSGFNKAFLERFNLVPLTGASSVCGKAAQVQGRVMVEDLETDPEYEAYREIVRSVPFRAAQSTPLLNSKGELLGILSTHFKEARLPSDCNFRMLDLYALHAANLIERLRAEEALQQADRRKDEFLATLSHELRNPLAPIKNALHILESPRAKEEIREEARKMMQRQVHQMTRLINDLMDVSRISQGKIELQKQHVTVDEVIEAAIEIAKPVINEKKHDLAVIQPHEPIWLEADMVRLSQVFANLLNNAAKYTNIGGHITLSVRKEEGEAIIAVRDDGIGIPQDMLSCIFSMFVQVDSALERAQGGLGIGLTLVKELVKLHGGRIHARSEGEGERKGSEFIVYLPAASYS